MKWLVLLIALMAIPPFVSWLKKSRGLHRAVWVIFGFLLFLHGPLGLYMAPVAWGAWPGYVKGIELSVVDLMAVSLFLSLPATRTFLSLKVVAVLYLAAVLLSVLQAQETQAALFYAWQLLRVFFVAIVVSRGVAAHEKTLPSLLTGLGIGLLVAVAAGTWEKYVGGALQAGGVFEHQNLLGMMSYLVAFPFLAMLLGGSRGWLAPVVAVGGLLVGILTVSRAALGIILGGYVLLMLFSIFRGWSTRKMVTALLGIAVLIAVAPLGWSSLQSRLDRDAALSRQSAGTPDERALFERTASIMLAENPMGVGANHYVLVANTKGYFDRAGVIPTIGSRRAPVHNTYWLVAAETGYLGLAAFVLLLAVPLAMGIRTMRASGKDPRGDLLLGVVFALAAAYAHGLYEWLLASFHVQFLLAALFGIIAGVAHQFKNPSSESAQSRPRPLPLMVQHGPPSVTQALSSRKSS